MTKAMKAILALAVGVSLVVGPAAAQEQEKGEKAKTANRVKTPTPLRVQVVFHRYQGERKIASLPYTVALNSDERPGGRLRMGINVPLSTTNQGAVTVVYKSVGTNIDCSADAMPDGQYRLELVVEQSSIYTPEGQALTSAGPVLREFSTRINAILRDGQSQQYTTATDPINGEVVKVEVTLNVGK